MLTCNHAHIFSDFFNRLRLITAVSMQHTENSLSTEAYANKEHIQNPALLVVRLTQVPAGMAKGRHLPPPLKKVKIIFVAEFVRNTG